MTEASPGAERCRNCEAPLPGEYCAACGQRRFDPRLTVRGLLAELSHAFDYDNRILLTLRQLLLRPGRLTADFLEGRRARYLSPAKVYLSASLVFFAAFFSFGNFRPYVRDGRAVVLSPTGVTTITRGDEDPGGNLPRARPRAAPEPAASPWRQPRRWLEQKRQLVHPPRGAKYTQLLEAAELRHRSYQARAPLVVVALVPLFALLSFIFYRDRQRLYLPHLYFALHVHAFGLLVLAVLVALNMLTRQDPAAVLAGAPPRLPLIHVRFPLQVLGGGHVLLALKQVFAESWPVTLLRGGAILLIYGFLIYLSFDLLDLLTVLLA